MLPRHFSIISHLVNRVLAGLSDWPICSHVKGAVLGSMGTVSGGHLWRRVPAWSEVRSIIGLCVTGRVVGGGSSI